MHTYTHTYTYTHTQTHTHTHTHAHTNTHTHRKIYLNFRVKNGVFSEFIRINFVSMKRTLLHNFSICISTIRQRLNSVCVCVCV